MLVCLLLLIASQIPVEMASPLSDASEEQTTTIAASTNDTTSTPGCSSCDMDRVKEWKIEMIMSSILEKLGMTHPPNITLQQLPENPPFIEDLQQFAYMEEDENMFADTPTEYIDVMGTESLASVKRVLIMATVPPEYIGVPNSACFNTELKGKSIDVSSLWVYVDKATVVQRTVTHLRVYMLIEATPTSPTKKKLYKTKTISLSTTKGSWERFDAKQLTREWMKDTSITHRYIVLEAMDSAGNNLVITAPNDRHRPVLDITTRNRKHVTRTPPNQACPEVGRKPCCLHPIVIDFKEIGWDFVLAPRSFKSHYCNGDCSVSFSRFNRHTQLLFLNNSPTPCCSARKHSNLKLLYFTDNAEVVLVNIKDIIVEECGCV